MSTRVDTCFALRFVSFSLYIAVDDDDGACSRSGHTLSTLGTDVVLFGGVRHRKFIGDVNVLSLGGLRVKRTVIVMFTALTVVVLSVRRFQTPSDGAAFRPPERDRCRDRTTVQRSSGR